MCVNLILDATNRESYPRTSFVLRALLGTARLRLLRFFLFAILLASKHAPHKFSSAASLTLPQYGQSPAFRRASLLSLYLPTFTAVLLARHSSQLRNGGFGTWLDAVAGRIPHLTHSPDSARSFATTNLLRCESMYVGEPCRFRRILFFLSITLVRHRILFWVLSPTLPRQVLNG